MECSRHAVLSAIVMVVTCCGVQGQVVIEWTTVGDAGNADDVHDAGYGGVDYVYDIGKYEVTNGQYREFLNAVAKTDTYGLYFPGMAGTYGGIIQSGSPGNYIYSEKVAGWDERPVTHVSFYDALRFANWLHNDQPTGPQNASTTEDGAYTFSGETTVGDRNPDARVVLPSEDEWYKAAYYVGGGTNAGYWDYATQSNSAPVAEPPPGGTNSANYETTIGGPYYTNIPGAYVDSPSAYGTYGQSGNLWEWNEALIGDERGMRGGSWFSPAEALTADYRFHSDLFPPTENNSNTGFRLARPGEPESVPAVAEWTLPVMAGLLLLLGVVVLRSVGGECRQLGGTWIAGSHRESPQRIIANHGWHPAGVQSSGARARRGR